MFTGLLYREYFRQQPGGINTLQKCALLLSFASNYQNFPASTGALWLHLIQSFSAELHHTHILYNKGVFAPGSVTCWSNFLSHVLSHLLWERFLWCWVFLLCCAEIISGQSWGQTNTNTWRWLVVLINLQGCNDSFNASITNDADSVHQFAKRPLSGITLTSAKWMKYRYWILKHN